MGRCVAFRCAAVRLHASFPGLDKKTGNFRSNDLTRSRRRMATKQDAPRTTIKLPVWIVRALYETMDDFVGQGLCGINGTINGARKHLKQCLGVGGDQIEVCCQDANWNAILEFSIAYCPVAIQPIREGLGIKPPQKPAPDPALAQLKAEVYERIAADPDFWNEPVYVPPPAEPVKPTGALF